MWYKRTMWRTLMVSAVLSMPVSAQVQPDAQHFAAARNMLAVQEAVAQLKAQAAKHEAEAAAREVERQRYESERMADLRFLDVHAARVQQWAGVRRASILPGEGWHEVRK